MLSSTGLEDGLSLDTAERQEREDLLLLGEAETNLVLVDLDFDGLGESKREQQGVMLLVGLVHGEKGTVELEELLGQRLGRSSGRVGVIKNKLSENKSLSTAEDEEWVEGSVPREDAWPQARSAW